jgi:hypothetical protein
MRMTADLERIGDYAKNFAKLIHAAGHTAASGGSGTEPIFRKSKPPTARPRGKMLIQECN